MTDVMTPEQLSKLLHIKQSTLAKWRSLRKGPAYFKAGGAPRYKKTEIDKWTEENNKPPIAPFDGHHRKKSA